MQLLHKSNVNPTEKQKRKLFSNTVWVKARHLYTQQTRSIKIKREKIKRKQEHEQPRVESRFAYVQQTKRERPMELENSPQKRHESFAYIEEKQIKISLRLNEQTNGLKEPKKNRIK